MRILIADDVELVAEAFEALLNSEPDFEVVGRVNRGDLVVDAVLELQPDVAVLDVDMPGLSGIEAAEAVAEAAPECRVLLLTAMEGSGHLHKAIASGAAGYVVKSTTGDRLIQAIRTVADGGTAVDPELAAEALRRGPSPLTDQEARVLALVGEGYSTEAIAKEASLSVGTVRNYISNAMTKVGVESRSQAFLEAQRQGWLQ